MHITLNGMIDKNAITQVEMLSDTELASRGERLAALLYLRKDRSGRYDTSWGTKTPRGLYLSVLRNIFEVED